MRKILASLLIAVLCLFTSPLSSRVNAQGAAASRFVKHIDKVEGEYIVSFKSNVPSHEAHAKAKQLSQAFNGKILKTYRHALKGFIVQLPEAAAIALSNHPLIDFVEENVLVTLLQAPPGGYSVGGDQWGLDRIDQRYLPPDNRYFPTRSGRGVNVYVVDSGILTSHPEFEGRAIASYDAFNSNGLPGGTAGQDCAGHGTRTASIIGGRTTGVAKEAKLHAVRISNCQYGTSGTPRGTAGYQSPLGTVLTGIEWVAQYHQKPAVANLGFAYNVNDAFYNPHLPSLDRAVSNLVARGVTVVTGAGNDNRNAIEYSPARVPEVITAAAIDTSDYKAAFSGYGSTVDVFAPGCCHKAADLNNGYIDFGGTSAATAFVTGVAALYLEANPSASPYEVSQALINNATVGVVRGDLRGSPNRLLYSNFLSAPNNTFSLSAANYYVNEGDRNITVTVNRAGNVNSLASITFSTIDTTSMNENPISRCTVIDGKASERCDYSTTIRRLEFAPGETSKNVVIHINDDTYAEGNETASLSIGMAKNGDLSAIHTATLMITDNDMTASSNPIDDARFFVRAHYVDFLSREPDVPGWDFWTGEITLCGANPQCIDSKRVNTSGSFFLSSEFQSTGYFVYRVFEGSLGRQPNYLEFIPDVTRVASGIVVNNALSPTVIDANKASFTREFVTRPEFRSKYDLLGNEAYVDTLAQTTAIALTSQERADLINGLYSGAETRPTVLYKIVDGTRSEQEGVGVRQVFTTRYGQAFYNAEYNPAFVLMQYFGYLRRNADQEGYNFWLAKLNQYGNYIDAEMVRSFIVAEEYRKRFGQQ